MKKGERLTPVEIPILELLEPPDLDVNPALQVEISQLGDLQNQIAQIYEQYTERDNPYPGWYQRLPARSITLRISWDDKHPVLVVEDWLKSKWSGDMIRRVVDTGATDWLQAIEQKGIEHPYVGDRDLWIPHNWQFLHYHVSHGGKSRRGGTVFYYTQHVSDGKYVTEVYSGKRFVGKY